MRAFGTLALVAALAQLSNAQKTDVRLAVPGDAASPEFKSLATELNSLLPEFNFVVLGAKDDADATDLVISGEADIAETDSAGVLEKEDKLQTVAVMINGDGRTSYTAQAYVRADSGINSFAQLQGKRACHTGFLKSAGMFMPIGYGVRNGFVEEKATLAETVESFFSAGSCAAPTLCSTCKSNQVNGQCAKDPYSDYSGALMCLSEDAGDVAFIKDSTYESTCGPEVTPRPAWCLPQNQVRKLVDVGAVPSHMVVARAAGAGGRRALDQATIDKIRAGLIAKVNADNSLKLDALMDGAIGFKAVPLAQHVAEYRSTVGCVPELFPGETCTKTTAAQGQEIRLAIPGDANAPEFQALPAELNALFPELKFVVLAAKDDNDATNMVIEGKADIAETDSAGILEKEDKLQTVAVMINGDGRTSYTAQAYVRANSGINSFAQLKGKRACHTGFLKSAGMFMPIGYGVRNGFIEEKATLAETVESFFSAGSCAAPTLCSTCKSNQVNGQCAKDPYSDYSGALMCLSEDAGDVAFIKDSTYESTCGPEVTPRPAWCLPQNQVRKLVDFGAVPSHMVVARAAGAGGRRALDQATIDKIRAGLIAKVNADNSLKLDALMDGAIGFKDVPLAQHVAEYRSTVGCVPELFPGETCTKTTAAQGQVVRLAIPGDANAPEFQALPAELNALFPELKFVVLAAKDDNDATNMVIEGKADIAETDSAGILEKEDKLQTVAVMINGDGRTSYIAQAYVRANSGINSFAQLKGKRACHTGFLKSAGMFMPIGYGVRNGFIEEKATLAETVESFFSAGSCAAPTLCSTCKSNQVNGQCAKDPYSDYSGALMCLSEDAGDVAFIKDSTYESTCGPKVTPRPAWCLPQNQVRKLVDVGAVPSHMVVARAAGAGGRRALDQATIDQIRAGLIAKVNADNSLKLDALMDGAIGFKDVALAQHVGEYRSTVGCVPELFPGETCTPTATATAATAESPVPVVTYTEDTSNTRDIAIAGLSIAVISLLAMPLVAYMIAKRLVKKNSGKQMLMDDQSRRTSVASNGHMNGYSGAAIDNGARLV